MKRSHLSRPIKTLIITSLAAALTSGNIMALDGAWCGELKLGAMNLPLVFNFSESDDGKTSCSLDSPAQNVSGIATDVIFCTSDSVSIECKTIGAMFCGKVSPEEIKGTFTQRGYSFPLTLTSNKTEDKRPQTPRPPYPYSVRDTVFTSRDGAVLSATLTLPDGNANENIPAVVMVSGSGPQNRDEEIFGHKPFAVIADYLARHGIASLRYDDRGTGKSTGDFSLATTHTFCDDARNATEMLRTIPGIGKVGILGHSEGGTIAFMLGGEQIPDFIISLAGMAVSGKETMLWQNRLSLDQTALSEEVKGNILRLIDSIFDKMHEQRLAGAVNPIDIDSLAAESASEIPQFIMTSLKNSQKNRLPWLDIFIGIDPAEKIASISCPLLAISGDKDMQVDATTNLAVIERLLPKAKIMKMQSLNHLLQHASTGSPTEYAEIRETIAPEVLDSITDFISSASR